MLISVIVPMYNEQDVIAETYRRLTNVCGALDICYELIFIDDGSGDRTMQIMRECAAQDQNVRLIALARNSGQQIAITAGLDAASGDAAFIIDADLQDPPELLPKMLDKLREGYDVVYGRRIARKGESFIKKASASVFYSLVTAVSGFPIPKEASDFRLISRRVIGAIRAMPEHSRYLRGMYAWIGFRQTPVDFVREERFAGETKYTLKKMLRLAADGIFSFSSRPLALVGGAGGILLAGGILYMILLLILFLCGIVLQPGWQISIAATLAVGGMILMALSLLGAYVGRIFEDVKGRPLYFVMERIGFPDQN